MYVYSFIRCERQKCVCSNLNVHKYRICDLSDGFFFSLNVMLMLQRQIGTQRSNTKNSAAAAAAALFTYNPKRLMYISITLQHIQHILFFYATQIRPSIIIVRARPTSTIHLHTETLNNETENKMVKKLKVLREMDLWRERKTKRHENIGYGRQHSS